MALCVGSIEYFSNSRLDGKTLTWIKLRLLCDSDGYTLWNDSFTDLADVRSCLESNSIDVYDVREEAPNLYVARATPQCMNELNEWKPNASEGLCVRTFLTIRDHNSSDMFSSDSCWLSTMIGDKSIQTWFERIKDIPRRF